MNLCDTCLYDRDSCNVDEAIIGYRETKGGRQNVFRCGQHKDVGQASAPGTADAVNCPKDCMFAKPWAGGSAMNPEVGGCDIEDQLPYAAGTSFDRDPTLPMCQKYVQDRDGRLVKTVQTAPEAQQPAEPTAPSQQDTPPPSTPIGAKPDEDFGACACGWPYKRTPFTKEHDAVRCVNPRCNMYREVARRVPALSMKERVELSKRQRMQL